MYDQSGSSVVSLVAEGSDANVVLAVMISRIGKNLVKGTSEIDTHSMHQLVHEDGNVSESVIKFNEA